MISTLQGKVIFKGENFLILDIQGVGFQVFLSGKSLNKIPQIGQPLKLFTFLDVGERSLKLYGFLTFEEVEFFKILRDISGVGSKAALEIVSLDKPEKVKEEIEKGNVKILDDIPGIGPKKAKKIILELSGKLKFLEPSAKKEKSDFSKDEAFTALLNLGFKKEEIKKALASLPQDIKDPQEKIKQALKTLGK